MPGNKQTPVLIVGGGPVGMTLAMDLAWRGIDVTIVERRHAGEPPEPKCNHVSARSMEIYRRLGVAAKLRNEGLPEDYPNDVSYRTSFTGTEFARIHIPCRRDRFTDKSGPDGDWPTPEPPHRANQIFLEPVLFEHVASLPRVTILNRMEIESVEQSDAEAVATVRNLETGDTARIACCYLVGCDGGRSTVRRTIGARLEGDAVVQRVQATFIRAPELIRLQKDERSWMTNTVNPRRSGNVIAIDGRERWMVFNYLKPDEPDFEAVDRDWAIRTILGVGPEFHYEILSKEDWYGRRLIANKFREARVFLAGDAAHIWVPYAGYGMNAGIADAMDLSWLLAAHLNGWAPARILDAYEAERWPITEQVSRFAMTHAEKEIARRGAVPAAIDAPGIEGDRARADAGRVCYDINVHQFCCGGLNFGTYYENSPIIAYDGAAHPAFSMSAFTPSTVPGCRTPHVWLSDGRSVYDAMGPEYTLLCFDPEVEVAQLVAAARQRGVPLAVVDVDSPQTPGLYTTKLVLSRPDQHVAWRGDACPKDSLGLIDLIRGAGLRSP
jgi:2-polyprenyl-6-methoxyphenol hydroxylase-like FAD-dependent oxidoreductase